MGIFDFFKKKGKVVKEETMQEQKTPLTQKKGYKHIASDGTVYYYNEKELEFYPGEFKNIRFFSKNLRKEHCDLPKDMVVRLNEDGLPYVTEAGKPDIGLVKYKYRLALNVTRFGDGQELYRYDVYDAYLDEFPDGYGSFVDGENEYHISSADNGNIKDYPYFQGEFNESAESELESKYEDGYTETVDEFEIPIYDEENPENIIGWKPRAFELLSDIEKFVLKDAKERFSAN